MVQMMMKEEMEAQVAALEISSQRVIGTVCHNSGCSSGGLSLGICRS